MSDCLEIGAAAKGRGETLAGLMRNTPAHRAA